MLIKTHQTSHVFHSRFSVTSLGRITLGGLLLLLFALFCPIAPKSTQAAEDNLQTNLLDPSIALAITDNNIDLAPTSTGTSASATTSLQVSTTSNAGYSLYLSTDDGTTSMVQHASSAELPTLSSTQPVSQLPANTWGYSLAKDPNADTILYSAFPAVETEVATTDTAFADDHYDLTIGVNLNNDLPAGRYEKSIVISAIAHPNTLTGFLNLTYMQDMTNAICQSTLSTNQSTTIAPGYEPSKQLIDQRDGKKYWVSRLADGNCWMTQNLAYDLVQGKVLTGADTDITAGRSWTIPTTTEKSAPTPVGNPLITEYRSWNFGTYALATPLRGVPCNSAPANGSTLDNGNVSLRPYQTIAQNCSDFVDVSGVNWQPTFNSSLHGYDQNWSGTNYNSSTKQKEPYTYQGLIAVDRANSTYDAHYLVGNYYQFNTATAGSHLTGFTTTTTTDGYSTIDARDSICPKGWKLPVAGKNTDSNSAFYGMPLARNGSYYTLLKAYGYPSAQNYTLATDSNGKKIGYAYTEILTNSFHTSSDNIASQDYRQAPLYFANAGDVGIWNGVLAYLGSHAMYWASSIQSVGTAAYNAIAYNTTSASSSITLWSAMMPYGMSVRCLAK